MEQLQEQLDEEQAAKQEVQAKYSRANAEAQQWKNKYDMEGLNRAVIHNMSISFKYSVN